MKKEEPHEREVCGAKNRQGKPCQRAPMPNGRCNLHGGKSTGRPITTGARSKFLKDARLAERLTNALADPSKLINQAENLATLEMMIASKMEELGQESGAELWQLARKDFASLRKAIDEGPDAFSASLKKLGATIENGLGYEKRLNDVRDLIQEQAQIAKVEISRREKEEQSLSAREAALFRQILLGIVLEEVTSALTERGIEEKIVKLRLARIAARFAQAYS